MNYKTCTNCNEELPATLEHFYKRKRGIYDLSSTCKKCTVTYNKLYYIPIPKKTEKCCKSCKKIFSLTGDYFRMNTIKKGTINKKTGNPRLTDWVSYGSVCIPCDIKAQRVYKRKKLMVKYGASTEKEYNAAIKQMRIEKGLSQVELLKEISYKKRKYNYPDNITQQEMERIKKLKDKGYNLETYDIEWKKKWLKSQHAKRKYSYPDGLERISKSLTSKQITANLTDGYIAGKLGFKLEDIPQEIIELKRKQLKFYRDVKNKKDENRNNF